MLQLLCIRRYLFALDSRIIINLRVYPTLVFSTQLLCAVGKDQKYKFITADCKMCVKFQEVEVSIHAGGNVKYLNIIIVLMFTMLGRMAIYSNVGCFREQRYQPQSETTAPVSDIRQNDGELVPAYGISP